MEFLNRFLSSVAHINGRHHAFNTHIRITFIGVSSDFLRKEMNYIYIYIYLIKSFLVLSWDWFVKHFAMPLGMKCVCLALHSIDYITNQFVVKIMSRILNNNSNITSSYDLWLSANISVSASPECRHQIQQWNISLLCNICLLVTATSDLTKTVESTARNNWDNGLFFSYCFSIRTPYPHPSCSSQASPDHGSITQNEFSLY